MVRKKTTEISSEVKEIAKCDAEKLEHAQESYGDSWKKRGGVGAFMMLARKWDRLENQTKRFNYDIFQAIHHDSSPEGILDDIGDLRRYLFLVEAELRRELSNLPLATPQEPTEAKREGSALSPLGTLVEEGAGGTEGTD